MAGLNQAQRAINRFLEVNEMNGISPFTLDYRQRLLKVFDAPEITKETCLQFLGRQLRIKRPVIQVLLTMRLLRAVAEQMIEDGLLETNPVKIPKLRPPPPKERKPITHEEFEKLMVYLTQLGRRYRSYRHGRRHWVYAVMIGWHTGLRLTDMALLRWDSVDLERDMIILLPHKTRRFGKRAEIPISPELKAYLLTLPRLNEYVYPEIARMHLAQPNVLSIKFVDVAKLAGVHGKSYHCFRHGFITRLLSRGVSSEIVGSITGQSTEQIATYQHITIETKKAVMSQLWADWPVNHQPNIINEYKPCKVPIPGGYPFPHPAYREFTNRYKGLPYTVLRKRNRRKAGVPDSGQQ